MNSTLSRGTAPSDSSGIDAPDERMTRRERRGDLGRAALAGGVAYVGRPQIRTLLWHIGYGGTGHGLLPAIARRLLRWWW